MKNLVVTPDSYAIAELRQAWAWLLKEQYEPILFSAVGDMFFETATGQIFWLNTGTGETSEVAQNSEVFRNLLNGELMEEWLLPDLVGDLIAADKALLPNQCYSFTILPIFKEGLYSTDNLAPMNMKEHFGFTGMTHEQLHHLPDGDIIEFIADD